MFSALGGSLRDLSQPSHYIPSDESLGYSHSVPSGRDDVHFPCRTVLVCPILSEGGRVTRMLASSDSYSVPHPLERGGAPRQVFNLPSWLGPSFTAGLLGHHNLSTPAPSQGYTRCASHRTGGGAQYKWARNRNVPLL